MEDKKTDNKNDNNPQSSQDNQKHPKPSSKKKMLISYGLMGHLGWFEHDESEIPKKPLHAVIKTDRGLELGKLVGEHNYRHGNYRLSEKQVQDYYCKAFENREQKDLDQCPVTKGGTFVRFATHDDLLEAEHLRQSARKELKTCDRFAKELGLEMKLIDAEHLLGGERIIIYFTSNGRVDFRELVKKLAREYQTRIELRQVGSRDEAKIIADFESCGQECCCKRFLKILEPVNMKMAKIQKATLDPSKISGHCGRLKCCLRYEDQTYRKLKKSLPRKNTDVKTPEGKKGTVLDSQVLTQLVVVQDEQGNKEAWPVDQLEKIKPGDEAGQEPGKNTENKNKDSNKQDNNARKQDNKVDTPKNDTSPENGNDNPQTQSNENAAEKSDQNNNKNQNENNAKNNNNRKNRSKRNKRGKNRRKKNNRNKG